MAKYLVCYNLPPAVADYHDTVVADVAARFQIRPLNQRIPSHATIKIPFDTERIDDIERVTAQFANDNKPAPMTIGGFGAFNQNVIYMDIQPSEAAQGLADRYIARLEKEISWLPIHPYDRDQKLHATIAKRLPAQAGDIRNQFDEIWRYVTETYQQSFPVSFNNITILTNDQNKRWYEHKMFWLS